MAFVDAIEDYGRVCPHNFVVNSFQGRLGPYDALAVFHYPPWVLTSPNMQHIPFIDLEIEELRARADGRFGVQDYAVAPQVHAESYPWLPFVLRQPATLELRDAHPHGILWDNLCPSDFVCPAGCSFAGLGVLEAGLHAHFSRHLRGIEQSMLLDIRNGSYPPNVSYTAAAMMAIVRRLRELPMTYRDLNLQWTQAQRLALDLLAMQAYKKNMFARLMQRDRVWPLAPEYMGCYTENPTTVENMFYAGIPVVYLRLDSALSPSMLRVRNVVTSFFPLAPHVVVTDWPGRPCNPLHIGAGGASRIIMNRPLGRYFEDLPPLPGQLPDNGDISLFRRNSDAVCNGHWPPKDVPVPAAGADSPDSDTDIATEPNDDHSSAGPNDHELAVGPIDNNVDRFSDFRQSSPVPDALQASPEPCTSSSKQKKKLETGCVVKQPVQPNSRKARKQCVYALKLQHCRPVSRPLQHAPPPVNRDKWDALIGDFMPIPSAEWISARQSVKRHVKLKTVLLKSDVGMMFPDPGYFQGCHERSRLIAIAAWLSIRAMRCGQMAYPDHPNLPVASASTWRKFFNIWKSRPTSISVVFNEDSTLLDDATAAAAAMFGPQMMSLMRDSSTEVVWFGTPYRVVEGAVQDMPVSVIRQISWELMELNWRYELLALDKVLAPHKWVDDEPSIAASSRSGRLPAFRALREVIWDWNCASDTIRFSLLHEPQTTDCPEAVALETHTMEFYCQTFYEYFHRPPTALFAVVAVSLMPRKNIFKVPQFTSAPQCRVADPPVVVPVADGRRGRSFAATSTGVYTLPHPNASAAIPAEQSLATGGAGGGVPAALEGSRRPSPEEDVPEVYDGASSEPGWSSDFVDPSPSSQVTVAPTNVNATQWSKWTTVVIPALFSGLFDVTIQVCRCTPAPQLLLARSLMACSPTNPSLAIDLKLLDFARLQFLHMAPNTTGWCAALEACLKNLGYKLKTRDTLRRRFSNGLRWYYALLDAVEASVQGLLAATHETLAAGGASGPLSPPTRMSSPLPPSSPPPLSSPNLNSPTSLSNMPSSISSPTSRSSSPHFPSHEDSDTRTASPLPPDPGPPCSTPASSRPSAYLRRRCHLCFGSISEPDPSVLAHYVASIDACFTQKRTQNHVAQDPNYRDTHRAHHDSRFLSEAEVAAMEKEVAGLRQRAPTRPKNATQDDAMEPGMLLPTSVLDDCGDSFIAADEKREKASTQFFADTGIMALLCRHDRCLFAVNMTHSGERQHYALALIKKFFEHLPPNGTLGLLYDIACQLKRSMLNFGFLRDLFPRITFAVSIFHAYGHQWPCQVRYHPRKCTGFGLSDGEGCERFWSALRKLIPSLRVSGYYQHLFILDLHIKYLDNKSREDLALWLVRRWKKCRVMKENSVASVLRSGIPRDVLREQWAAQVAAQTQPAPRQSKKKGDQAIQAILALDASIKTELATIREIHASFERATVDISVVHDALESARSHLKRLEKARAAKFTSLGVAQSAVLVSLKSNKYLTARMNTLALKHRLRDRLRQRKFEMERLERSYRRTMNEIKSTKHIEGAVKRRAPTIQHIAKKYNDLCTQIAKMVQQKTAPAGVIP
ncbi:hypothetical protein HWV62_37237 [Athelia sp. TMB]|nr:hypothetical protein HWV62_37237 [Athelia sp. TMB]